MKPFKTIYMTFHEGDIIFPKAVQYFEDGYYICTGQLNNKYIVSDRSIAKLTQEDFDRLIICIHNAMYTGHTKIIEIRNIDDDIPYLLQINPNGYIRCGGHSCTIYVPRNCLKWDCALLHGYYNDSYVLKPCDKNGKVLEKTKYDINPYTNNCNIIYNVISEHPGISTSELIDKLEWPPNSVTSRLSELMSGGRIYSIGRVLNPKSGRKVHKWVTDKTTGC